jgi:hypothetical protein
MVRINYEAASVYTKMYTGKGNTIFDKFDILLMPVAHSSSEFSLVTCNFGKKELLYYDTLLSGEQKL